jgi:hypothetical protein
LFYILELGYGAAKAHQAVAQENPHGLGIFLHHLADRHLFGNRHGKNLLF